MKLLLLNRLFVFCKSPQYEGMLTEIRGSHWLKTALHFDGIICLRSNFYVMHSVHLHCFKAENQQLNRIFALSV